MENPVTAASTTLTITLSPEQAQKLERQAQQAGTSPEEVLRQHVADWLDAVPVSSPDFDAAAAYVLQKNAELYRRLS